MAGASGTSKKNDESEKGVRAQASVDYQMQRWLSESDKEAPWTPLNFTTSSAGNSDTGIQGNLEDVSDDITIQGHTRGSSNA
ncbi:hypothetical protein ACQKWADRAFT_282908 [Trichoderma austrokoningii]